MDRQLRVFNSCGSTVSGMEDDVRDYGSHYETASVSGILVKQRCQEILGYSCKLTGWEDRDCVKTILGPANYRFLETEFREWVSPPAENPGEAWREDPGVWEPFLTEDRKFTYTYNERFFLKHRKPSLSQLDQACEALVGDPRSRQAFVGIWDPGVDLTRILSTGPEGRVPCTIGYHFFLRPDGQETERLHMIYLMRSLNASWNIWNDLFLVTNLFDWFLQHLLDRGLEHLEPGSIVIQANSLHIFH